MPPIRNKLDEEPDTEGHRSRRQQIRGSMQNPGADDKERGEVRSAQDGTLQWWDPKDETWRAAIYHKDIRNQLLDIASDNGRCVYDFPRSHGITLDDQTAFLAAHQDWSPERDLWPRMTDDILNRLERRAYRGRNAGKTPRILYFCGGVVLDHDNHPVRCFEDLPIVLSSAVDGWELELFFRLDARVQRKDIRARLPSQINNPRRNNVDLFGMSALGNRRMRFRKDAGILAWETRQGSAPVADFMKARLPAGAIEANTTRDVGSLTAREKDQLQAIEDSFHAGGAVKNEGEMNEGQRQLPGKQLQGGIQFNKFGAAVSAVVSLSNHPASGSIPYWSQGNALHPTLNNYADDSFIGGDEDSLPGRQQNTWQASQGHAPSLKYAIRPPSPTARQSSSASAILEETARRIEASQNVSNKSSVVSRGQGGTAKLSAYEYVSHPQRPEASHGKDTLSSQNETVTKNTTQDSGRDDRTARDNIMKSHEFAPVPRSAVGNAGQQAQVPQSEPLAPQNRKRVHGEDDEATTQDTVKAPKRRRGPKGNVVPEIMDFALLHQSTESSLPPHDVPSTDPRLQQMVQLSMPATSAPANPPERATSLPTTTVDSPEKVPLPERGNSEGPIDEKTFRGRKLAQHLAIDFRQRAPVTPRDSLEVQRVLEYTRQDFRAWLRNTHVEPEYPATNHSGSYSEQLSTIVDEFKRRWESVTFGCEVPVLKMLMRWRGSFYDWNIEDLSRP